MLQAAPGDGAGFGKEVSLGNLTYPLVNVYITMENHHAIIGKSGVILNLDKTVIEQGICEVEKGLC